MKYKNYKLKRFLKLASKDEKIYHSYMPILKYLNYQNYLLNFRKSSLTELKFIEVRTIQEMTSREFDIVELVSYITGIPEKKLLNIRIFKFYAFLAWVNNEIERILKAEESLIYSPDGKQLQAGIESLYKFGVFGEVDALASGDLTKHEQIMELPYNVVFTKQKMNLEQMKFEKNYTKLITK